MGDFTNKNVLDTLQIHYTADEWTFISLANSDVRDLSRSKH